METPDIEQVKQKATETASRLGEELKEQWHQVREQAPEFLYGSTLEAAAANARRTEANLAYYRENPTLTGRRLSELDQEWDVQRVLQVLSSGLTLTGFWLALTKSRLWTLLPLAMAGGALHHGLTGGSPAEDFVRRLGFRTRDEIEYERRSLYELDGTGRDSLFDSAGPNDLTDPSMG